jgi:hypothetical protein
MKITCPCCAAQYSIEAAMADESARRAVAAALAIPAPVGELLLRYAALFRPRSRALAWPRVLKLLEELQTGITNGRISWKGRTWTTTLEMWRQALEEIIKIAHSGKLRLPLGSHGYLHAILTGLADQAEAEQERQVEQQRRAPARAGETGTRSVQAIMSELRHFRDLAGLTENGHTKGFMTSEVERLEAELESVRAAGRA